MTGPISQEAAEEALAAIKGTRKRLAGPPEKRPGWGIPALFAALLSGLVAANSAPAAVFSLAIDTALVAAMFATSARLRARTGVSINGWRTRPARWVTVLLTGLYLIAALVSLWMKLAYGLWWAPLAGGVALFPCALWANLLWVRTYRHWLEQGR
jgi:hypothetical protein